MRIEIALESVTEPGMVAICFTAEEPLPPKREAFFQVSLSNLTTATMGFDFVPLDFTLLTIPANFIGAYEMCANVRILDDEEVEADEIIAYNVSPLLSELDSVVFLGNLTQIILTINDDEGNSVAGVELGCRTLKHMSIMCVCMWEGGGGQ